MDPNTSTAETEIEVQRVRLAAGLVQHEYVNGTRNAETIVERVRVAMDAFAQLVK